MRLSERRKLHVRSEFARVVSSIEMDTDPEWRKLPIEDKRKRSLVVRWLVRSKEQRQVREV
jgi:hypothetical protein